MRGIEDIQRELKETVALGDPEYVIKAIKAVLKPDCPFYGDLLLAEGRLREGNAAALRGELDNDNLQLLYNQLRVSLMALINQIRAVDILPEETAAAEAPATPKVRTGNILYRIPEAMQLEKEHKCIVRIAVNEALLLENLDNKEGIQTQGIRISEEMLVQLLDPSDPAPFRIRAVNSEVQFIDEDTYTEWLFYVKPIIAGTFPVLLKVAVLEMVNGKERRREIVLEESVQIITEPVPEEAAQPELKSTTHQLQFGLLADDMSIYAPQPAPAPSQVVPPRTGPAPKNARRAMAGVMRLLAMVGIITVAGVVYFQTSSNKSMVDPGVTFPVDIDAPVDSAAVVPATPTDTARFNKDTVAPLSKLIDTFRVSRPASKPVNPVSEWVKVRGGSFLMGCLDTTDCAVNQSPVHRVRMNDFFMSVTEVTRAQFAHFLNDYGSAKVKDGEYKNKPLFAGAKWLIRDAAGKWSVQQGMGQLPAGHITWYGAREFAVFYEMKLPSEAQWEFAAKGGRTNGSFNYSGSDDLEEVGWYRENSDKRPHPVHTRKPNALGLYDMSGNVWEWVADCAHPDYKGAPSNGKAWTTGGDCNLRMVRGGSYHLTAESCSVGSRLQARIDDAVEYIGFRVVK